jgi:transcriptional regulator with XRE-family HTH domain
MDRAGSSVVQKFANAPVHARAYNRRMDKKPHYLREWRKHAGLTQEQLAEAVGTSKSQISELERYNLQLSPKWLQRLAPVLKVQPGHILDHNPDDLDTDIIDIWARIPERDRQQAARVLRSFTRTGTDD